jgi:hypothetical protein
MAEKYQALIINLSDFIMNFFVNQLQVNIISIEESVNICVDQAGERLVDNLIAEQSRVVFNIQCDMSPHLSHGSSDAIYIVEKILKSPFHCISEVILGKFVLFAGFDGRIPVSSFFDINVVHGEREHQILNSPVRHTFSAVLPADCILVEVYKHFDTILFTNIHDFFDPVHIGFIVLSSYRFNAFPINGKSDHIMADGFQELGII